MLLFLDERAFALIELLSFWSHQNQKNVQPSSLLCYVFGRLSSERKVWKFAFSSLSGVLPVVKFPKRLQVRRAAFVSVAVETLSELAMRVTSAGLNNENRNEICLFPKVIKVLLTLSHPDCGLFNPIVFC
jgi:hypothetical protein